VDWLRRNTSRPEDSRALAQDALAREQEKRWPEAEALYRRALRAAQADPDEFNVAYLEGRLANALLRQDQRAEAKEILEGSLTRTSDVRIPASVSMLTGLFFDEGRWADAERILREGHQSQATRETRAGRVGPDIGTAALLLADAGVKGADAEPIARAERWASEAGDRGLWFAVAHRRGVLLEASVDAPAAIAHYRGLVDEGSLHEATSTRLFILLERAGFHDEAMLRARSALQQRWSASFEEQTRKRIARLEARLAPRGRKPAKEVIAAFSVREGTDALRWSGQLDVKGGAQSLTRWADGLLVTSGGKDAALLAVSGDLGVAERLRPMPSRASVLTSPNNERILLAVNEGTVADGHATSSPSTTVGSKRLRRDWVASPPRLLFSIGVWAPAREMAGCTPPIGTATPCGHTGCPPTDRSMPIHRGAPITSMGRLAPGASCSRPGQR
jgi:tetratricopeptide (TPR) repeat protein